MEFHGKNPKIAKGADAAAAARKLSGLGLKKPCHPTKMDMKMLQILVASGEAKTEVSKSVEIRISGEIVQ